MREIGLVATPNFQGAYVTASDQVHVLLRLKGLRKVSHQALHDDRETLLTKPGRDGLGTGGAFANAGLGGIMSLSAH